MSSSGPLSGVAARVRRRWGLIAVAVAVAAAAALVTEMVTGERDDVVVVAVAVAVAVGLLIGLVAAWIVEALRTTIGDPSDLAKLTNAPNLAIVPRHPLRAERPDDVTMFRDPNSIEAEGYRTLRTALEFITRGSTPTATDSRGPDDRTDPNGDDDPGDRRPGVIVLISSPRPGEGKSSVAANLAAASAMAGRRVVLVDADLRKPQVHRLFRLANDSGLASVLTGDTRLADATQRLDGTKNLVVLAAGPPPPDPAELLANDRLGLTLASLAHAADLVVVDAPPLLAVADPMIIAQHCDAVVMVATADLSSPREWAAAMPRLDVVDASVVGTVLLQPDNRVRAVPTYRYAPSAVPANWWVAESERDARARAGEASTSTDEWVPAVSVEADPADTSDATTPIVTDGWPVRRSDG